MASRVPFVDLNAQNAQLADELRVAFDRVVGASSFILGEEVERFESEFARYCGAEHCVGIASGTAALTIAMQAAGVGPGDEVIVPAHTFIASALGVIHAGASPVLCDVDEETGLIDLDSAAQVVTERTAAVLPVHLYGQACDMEAVGRFAERHGIAVFEDAAQAHGATCRGRRAGSFGDAAAFSFYPSKNLGALGDGGVITTNDAAIAERARMLRHLGQKGKGNHELAGYNERLDGLQAAFLRVKLPHLDAWNEGRRTAAAAYREELEGQIRLLGERPETPCVFHLFPIRVGERDRLARELAEGGIATGVHYSPALPEQPPLAQAPLPPDGCPRASAWAREELSLPMWEGLEPATAREVARTLAASLSDAERLRAGSA